MYVCCVSFCCCSASSPSCFLLLIHLLCCFFRALCSELCVCCCTLVGIYIQVYIFFVCCMDSWYYFMMSILLWINRFRCKIIADLWCRQGIYRKFVFAISNKHKIDFRFLSGQWNWKNTKLSFPRLLICFSLISFCLFTIYDLNINRVVW